MEKNGLYYSAAITVDVVIFTVEDGELKTLLIKRAYEPDRGSYALPGGFLQVDETIEQAAHRILETKAGVSGVYTEQLYTFDQPGRDPRGQVISVAFFALVPRSALSFESTDDAQNPELISISKLPALGFDHADIIEYAITRLRSKLEYTNAIYSLLPEKFTLRQLQDGYEAILGRELDKRNFQKKFLSLGLIEPTDEMTSNTRHRPARLYRFNTSNLQAVDRWF